MELFDSHCHLTDAAFRDDREAVLLRAREAGVACLVTIASTLEDAVEAVALARAHEGVWCTAGVHPHEAAGAPADAAARLRGLAALPEVVALGETGLDYHYDHSPRDVQRRLFDLQLALGAETGLPVVVHAREADDDIAAALRDAPSATRGVLHCFTGGVQAFEEAMARGWHVSFSGIASFRTFAAVDLLREVPADRLLVETDSPYLAPVPMRGKRNEPAFVRHVAEAVAAHLGESWETLAARTLANARSFYGLAG
ncbi:MAG: TatD family deoxyribonuclease [Gemmatimonadetes bacterium]|nr:TatD family deoxyribonuclease [Gemmatimonadota bacterium]